MTTDPTTTSDADLSVLVDDLRNPDNGAHLSNLRLLSRYTTPIQVGFNTYWLMETGLVQQKNEWWEFWAKFVITDKGRRALAAIDGAQ